MVRAGSCILSTTAHRFPHDHGTLMIKTAKKESNVLKKRIIFLESLLASNLENLTGCQRQLQQE
jgi:hypothetical protein